MTRYNTRRNKLRRELKRAGMDSILVTNFTNVTYLTGFTGDDSYLLITPTDEVMVSDSRYSQQLEEECPGLDVVIRTSAMPMMASLAKLTKKTGVRNMAVESQSLTLSLFDQLETTLAGVTIARSSGLVEGLREIKDTHEIQQIRDAIDLAERTFAVIRASLRPEQTEKEVAYAIENQIRLFGGSGCSFPPIVAVGPRAALPHAHPTSHQIKESGFVLIDWGAVGNLYISDLTRVLVTGKAPAKLERIYNIVLQAQLAAIKKIKPGAIMKDVDAAARSVITKAGYGKRFGHSLGHGIGLEVHEGPGLAPRQERPLKAGMVVTVEPGIYLPNWGGVRIEDDILVTRDGHEVLSSVPKQFSDCFTI